MFKDCCYILTKQAVITLVVILFTIPGVAFVIYPSTHKQASSETQLPSLYKKAKNPFVKLQNDESNKTANLKAQELEIISNEIWFDDIKAPASISSSENELLTRFAADSILSTKYVENSIPATLIKDNYPRIVFISASDGFSPAYVAVGSDKGIIKAIKRAASLVSREYKHNQQLKWIKLDVVKEVYVVDNVNFNKPLGFDRSLYGMSFNKQSGIAFLPEEMVSYTLVDNKQKIRKINILKYLKDRSVNAEESQRILRSGENTLYRFTTISSFYDGDSTMSLYRGHRLYNKISGEYLLSSAIRGGQYLTRSVGTNGKFVYVYRPKTDSIPDKYNILRHAGTVYAMLELYSVNGDIELLKAVNRAIKYLLSSVKPGLTEENNMACVVEKGFTKLGGNALAIIALAKYTEVTNDRQYMPVLLRLAKWIQNAQKESGEFYIQKQTYPDGEIIDFTSQYYPGEALLAMTRIYALDPADHWLDVAEKGANYLINIRDYGLTHSALKHDHWLLYALEELYRYRPDQLYFDHAMQIARSITQSQNRGPKQPDWLGSFRSPPRSTPTATRAEGLCAAYLLARDYSKPKEAEMILESIRLAVAFQLQTQFMPESVLYLKDPQRSLWGFHKGLTNYEIRIDYVQHNISSLLGYYRIINGKE